MRAYVRVCVCMERAVRCAIVRSPVHTHECAMHKFAHARVCTFVRVYVCLCVCVCVCEFRLCGAGRENRRGSGDVRKVARNAVGQQLT